MVHWYTEIGIKEPQCHFLKNRKAIGRVTLGGLEPMAHQMLLDQMFSPRFAPAKGQMVRNDGRYNLTSAGPKISSHPWTSEMLGVGVLYYFPTQAAF